MPSQNIHFSKEELARYSRHIILSKFGLTGQQKLKEAKVLVIGAGGLGSPLLLYLAAAGVGTIGIVDGDVVDVTNLQRQVLYDIHDVGKPKVEAAKQRLNALNPHIHIKTYNTKLTSENALTLLKEYDVIVDGTDNFPTRYLVNDACVLLNKPNVYGSIFQFEGQVSVFNYTDKNGNVGPNYRSLYPMPPLPESVPNCADAGVLGVLPGIIGTVQANEVIKIITSIGNPLSGRLFLFDALNLETHTLHISKDKQSSPITKLIDYEQFCTFEKKSAPQENLIKEITPKELKKKFDNKEDLQLIDVREPYEKEIASIGGELIPMAILLDDVAPIAKDKPVIIYCRTGVRSRIVIVELEKQFGFTNLYNLKGGIHAYSDDVDSSLQKY